MDSPVPPDPKGQDMRWPLGLCPQPTPAPIASDEPQRGPPARHSAAGEGKKERGLGG